MLRRIFLSFHHRDLWRAQIVRNSGAGESVALAGFLDAQTWEDVLRAGDAAVKARIDECLQGTSVTVVLIGAETADRSYISYEIERSIQRGNGIFGVRIHSLKDANGATSAPGQVPEVLIQVGAPVYNWQFGRLRDWIEIAAKNHYTPTRLAEGRDG